MAAKRKKQPGDDRDIARNRRARHRYEILETFEAGLALMGSEVKALRERGATIAEAYVEVVRGEAWLRGIHISEYANAGSSGHEPMRSRKLLLHKRQLDQLADAVAQRGLTIVCLRLYFNADGRAKAQIALARGKAEYDRRQDIKEREARREADRAVKVGRRS